jgi:hypothetical protein
MAGSSEAATPTLAYWHVWTDDSGVTHQTSCELSAFKFESMGGKAGPQWNDRLPTSEANMLFCILPVGWNGDWHENPKPQWIAVVAGRWFVETMDGTRVEMGVGEIAFGGDQNSKPDAQGRVGHRSGTLGDEPCTLMIVQLDGGAFVGARPGDFK